ncbi:uncharacterized protein SPPG_00480 [Spizellomyces punctatus DAOM BR117]|uniref:Anaphase-promoting complex subunit 4 WD40 domain-containing protein n=1 Tax=Spizellomyces punctatus (strain DAOM BR117) TaxID=645134 RepID=A0A0L0HUK7_SPIPD|nr:uncharacterized protein SPPG_00480 [Spizellomyces punctatus DAOM BR117]KND04777.1 hypothetical protein SPPG_00480 [Spizellomyces punctatus DAOM BR117]|eukprot:XP_016612816.1 hypothetical protein SPPG_00480 [Spizellomyces punctatus DAOM BR117]
MTSPPYTPFHLIKTHNPTTSYVLSILISPDGTLLAAPTSCGTVHLYDATTSEHVGGINVGGIKEAVFDKRDNVVWCGGDEVSVWDVREGKCSKRFQAGAPVLSLDVNSSQTMVAAGTELVGEDAKICIWDIRGGPTPLTEFTECHSDDITQIKFHPTHPTALASGSTDGLMCLYALTTPTEDDALEHVFKSDSISKIGFFGPGGTYLYALSHMETLSLYTMTGDTVREYGDVRGASELAALEYCIDATYDPHGERLFVVGGDQSGNMCALNVGMGGLELVHTLNGGHSDIVRGVLWDVGGGRLVSGGEDGKVCFWRNA